MTGTAPLCGRRGSTRSYRQTPGEVTATPMSRRRSVRSSNRHGTGGIPQTWIARSVEDEVETTARGFRRATSVYGTLTGLAGDIFIIDEPQKAVDA
jgi:hypothetical protein